MRFFVGLLLAYCVACNAAFASIFTISTGSLSGLYYSSGGALCRVFNLSSQLETKCITEATPGSQYNLYAVENELTDFAFVQADELFSYLQKNPETNIRVVFPFYTEVFTMLVSKNSGINSVKDLKNKVINIGVEGSGIANFTMRIIKFFAMKNTDFAKIVAVNQTSAQHMLCNNEIDATLVVAGHPSSLVSNLLENCGAKIIEFPANFIESILKENTFYTVKPILKAMYNNLEKDIRTIGTRALLISSKNTNEDIVYQLMNSMLQNFDSFKVYSPVVKQMSVQQIDGEEISRFPMHPISLKALREAGIVN